jgi:hypothetical protein
MINDSSRNTHVGGSITGSSIVSGDHSHATTTFTQVRPPEAASVDVAAELASLRALVEALRTPDRRRYENALEEAQEDSAKPEPDKAEIAGALERAVKIAKAAPGFLERANAIQDSVVKLAGWLGPAAKGVLALLGLSA